MDIKANHNLSWSRLAVLPLLLGAVTGCVHDDDDNDNGNATASYTVTVTNLTHNQPLTPPAVILHTEGYSPWTLGQSASTGLEKLAEGGDAADFTAEATANSNVITTSTGVDVLLPGASASFNLEAAPNSDLRVSAASRLKLVLAPGNSTSTPVDVVITLLFAVASAVKSAASPPSASFSSPALAG